MKVESRPDGWHLLADDGQHFGPFPSLEDLQNLMDLLENQERIKAKQQPAPGSENRPPLPGSHDPVPRFEI